MSNGVATSEDSVALSYKLNILLPYDLAVALLGIYPKELKIPVHTDLHKGVWSSFIYSCPNSEEQGCSLAG